MRHAILDHRALLDHHLWRCPKKAAQRARVDTHLTNRHFFDGIVGRDMKFVQLEQQQGVALLRLNRGVINALNLQVLRELSELLRGVKDDLKVRGLVLASANDKFFSIGFDLPELYNLSAEEFRLFFRTYNLLCLDLYTFPKPTVSALTGHATAGGCILALCTDYRLVAEGRRLIGVNEIRLGVPITYLADCILRQLLGDRQARDMIYSGKLLSAEEALRVGLVDQVLPARKVVYEALKKARDLGEMPRDAFAACKRLRVQAIEAQVLSYMEKEEELFIKYWYSSEARQGLKEAIDKFVPKD